MSGIKEMKGPAGRPARRRWLWWGSAGLLLFLAAAAALWAWRFRTYTPAAVAQDLRAAVLAHHDPKPAERFLELRYGPLTEPANRQRAFLDFFNVDHMEGLYRIVGLMQGEHRQAGIAATAQWVADYRRSMSPEEKEALGSYLRSEAGRLTLQRATAEYLKKDVAYRAATAPVIAELMATLAAVRKP